MAGSKQVFIYENDFGVKYLVSLDEGNAKAAGFPLPTSADLNLPVLPKYLKMRYLNVSSSTGVKRRIFIPDVAADLWNGTEREITLPVFTDANTAKGVVFGSTSRIGEKERYLFAADTGQTDEPGVGQTPTA